MTVYTPRRAARVLLVDAPGRVLLFSGSDPARPEHGRWWFTPGGGLDPGETYAEGAARELAEETGLRLEPSGFGAPVHTDVTEFPFDGVWYRQEQEFFLVRVTAHEVDTAGFNEVERSSVAGHRWWAVAELAATDERYYPPDLPAVLTRALAGAAGVGAAGGAPC
ncbi:NUDIX domain-containing protein [Micromonospora phytophila]|uniref:NUDIX hydrolase n=1 Tax=Micromonospora phytophila TaxID=709888 RepID=UPI00202E277C|nr:NUDIX domain-containing protein [Micromonospora phytophila]MCM0675041.1 NUDIX domain-containing protein [Micromonospora phytophila]